MADESTQSPNLGGYRQRADGQPRVNESKATANRAGKYQPVRDNPAKAAARAMFEGEPGSTCQSVAEKTGIPVGTVRRWKATDGWVASGRSIPNLSAQAAALANSFKVKMSELGKPLSDDVAAQEVSRELAVDHAVEIRAAVLDRHRKEWSAPRKLIYEAASKRDFELAKLAKITSETLQIVQVGECRAYGLNHESRGSDGGTVVVIDRQGAQQLPADEPLTDFEKAVAPVGNDSDSGEEF